MPHSRGYVSSQDSEYKTTLPTNEVFLESQQNQEQSEAFVYIKQEATEVNFDRIQGFPEFLDGFQSGVQVELLKKDWNIYKQTNGVCFYRLKSDEKFDNVRMSFKILLNEEMQVKIYENESEADITELNWILRNSKLERWSQFHNMLEFYHTEPHTQPISNPSHHIKQALESLEKVEDSKLLGSLLNTIKQQLNSALSEDDPIDTEIESEDAEHLIAEFKPDVVLDEVKSEQLTVEEYVEEDSYADDVDWNEKSPKKRKVSIPKPSQPRSQRKKKLKVDSSKKKVRTLALVAEGETFQCEHCDKIYNTKRLLQAHFYKNHNGSFCCDVCGKVFTSPYYLKDHMLRHQENSRVKCPKCDDMMLPESIRRHIRVRHEGYKPFACSICGKLFSSMTLVKEHEKIHTKMNGIPVETLKEGDKFLLECPKCRKRYAKGGQVYVKHVERCNSNLVEPRRNYEYPCTECDFKFHTKHAAAKHMLEIHQIKIANAEKFCFECKEEFDDPAHARSHCEFPCPMCGLRFISQGKLNNHMTRHDSNELRPFACEICDKRFKSNNHLQSHKTTVHASEEEKKFVCLHCDRRYAAQHLLRVHIQNAHSDVKRYSCTFCGMKFKKLDTMKNHCRLEHGEENPYRCSDCQETSKTLNELRRHQQETHGSSLNVQKFYET